MQAGTSSRLRVDAAADDSGIGWNVFDQNGTINRKSRTIFISTKNYQQRPLAMNGTVP